MEFRVINHNHIINDYIFYLCIYSFINYYKSFLNFINHFLSGTIISNIKNLGKEAKK